MLNNQDFDQIKNDLKNIKKLFKDPFFKPNDISIVGNRRWEDDEQFKQRFKNVVWKRPHEIIQNPVFLSNKLDLRQGRIGDCWLVSTLIAICNNKDLLYKLIPNDQNFKDEYCGMFHFKFYWEYQWVDVVVDDFLPVTGSIFSKYNLIFGSTESNTFWFPLLEKAVAKLFGGYTFLHDGHNITFAHTLLTGGISERIQKKNDCPFNLERLWNKLYNAFKNDTMFVCTSTKNYSTIFVDAFSHAVLIVDFVQFVDFDDQVRLVKLCDPGCTYQELWKGDWCLNSYSWKKSSNTAIKQLKQELVKKTLKCEWWMSFNDFTSHFDRCYVNYLALHPVLYKITENKEYSPHEMKQIIFTSCWKYNIGDKIADHYNHQGYYEMLENIPFNPQFLINVEDESSFFFELRNIDFTGQNSYYEQSNYKRTNQILMTFDCYKIKNWLDVKIENFNKIGLTHDFFGSFELFHVGWTTSLLYYKVKLSRGKYILLVSRAIRNDIECRFGLRVIYAGNCNIKPIGTPVTKTISTPFKDLVNQNRQNTSETDRPKSTFKDFRQNISETTRPKSIFKDFIYTIM